MEQRRYSERPEHHEYLLTDKGRELQAVIIALTTWVTGGGPKGPPILYEHAGCGAQSTRTFAARPVAMWRRTQRSAHGAARECRADQGCLDGA